MLTIKISYLTAHATPPKQATIGSAGWDLYAVADGYVPGGRTKRIPLGFAIELPSNWCARIKQRSSMFEKGLVTNDSPIDSDFRGELCVLVNNTGSWPWHYKKGDRIGQLLFEPVPVVMWKQVDELTPSGRNGGMGSTGR